MRTSALIFVFSLFTSSIAGAAQRGVGLIDTLAVNPSGGVFVAYQSSAMTGTVPTCASTHANSFQFDGTTPGGQAIYKLLLAAKLSGTTVDVRGNGQCNFVANIESISDVWLIAP